MPHATYSGGTQQFLYLQVLEYMEQRRIASTYIHHEILHKVSLCFQALSLWRNAALRLLCRRTISVMPSQLVFPSADLLSISRTRENMAFSITENNN
jgi:hypothetical protein